MQLGRGCVGDVREVLGRGVGEEDLDGTMGRMLLGELREWPWAQVFGLDGPH